MILSIDIGTKNFSWCLYDPVNARIHTWLKTNFIDKKRMDTKEITTKLFKWLETLEWDIISHVVVEQQTKRAIMNKTLEHSIWCWCQLKQNVVYKTMAPKRKFTLLGLDCPMKYSDRKRKAIQYCESVLDPNDWYVHGWMMEWKRDDMADAYMQAVAYANCLNN